MYFGQVFSRNLGVILNKFKQKFSTAVHITPVPLSFESLKGDPNLHPLVLVHGLFGSKKNWVGISRMLNRETSRSMISIDLRNHGDSEHTSEHTYFHMVEDLRLTLEQLNLKKVSLLGHSMGGRAVMLFSLLYPDLVEKLIVADISPVTSSPQLRATGEIFNALLGVEFPINVPMSVCRQHVTKHLSKHIDNSAIVAFLATNIISKGEGYTWAINVEVLKNTFDHISQFPSLDKKFLGPTLFLGGERSDYIPQHEHEGIYDIFPNSNINYISDAGHWVHVDNPKEFVKFSSDFLQS